MFYKLENFNIEEIVERKPVPAKERVKKTVRWNDGQDIEKSLEMMLSGKWKEITLTTEDFVLALYKLSDILNQSSNKRRKIPKIKLVFEEPYDLSNLLEYFHLEILNLTTKELEKEIINSADRSIRDIDQMISMLEVKEKE